MIQLTQALEDLMRDKKELELKERITRHALDGITNHMDHLFADKVGSTYSLIIEELLVFRLGALHCPL